MRTTFLAIILLLAPVPFALADTAGTAQSPASQDTPLEAPGTANDKEDGNKIDGMTLFLIVFIFAVLFVLSSATALNRLGGKPPARPAREPNQPRERQPSPKSSSRLPEGKERFRL